MRDSTATALDDARIIPDILNLADWDSATFMLSFEDPLLNSPRIIGTIDSLVLVPEPSTGLLVLMGLGVLGRARRVRTARADPA